MEALDVFLSEARAGTLTADDQGRMTFAFTTLDAPKISLSLPPRPEPYPDEACRPFFAGLLPEGRALARAAELKRLQVYETFKLLQAYGAECAGAIRLLQSGTPAAVPSEYEPLEGAALDAEIADIADAPIFARDNRARLSVAGVQSKTAVRVQDGRILKPLRGSPSTHIVKVAGPEYGHLVENEFFCMRLAARLKLEAAHVEMREAGGRKFLLVERYDRTMDGGRVRELHQEDFCQALAYPPERKYETDENGVKIGPSLEETFSLLDRASRVPGLDRQRLLRAVIFNLLIANADAHAKNYSLLYEPGSTAPRLAPLYDLVCTRIYPLTIDMAMRIGSSIRPDTVSIKNWELLAKQSGIRFPRLHALAQELCSAILPAAKHLQTEIGYLPAENIIRVIGGRIRDVAAALGLKEDVDVPPYVEAVPGWGRPS